MGPLRVVRRVGKQAYKLELPVALQRYHDVFHVSLPKPYMQGGDGVMPHQPITVDDETEWELESIIKIENVVE